MKGCTITQGLPSEVPDGAVLAFTVLCWSVCGCAGLSVILILYLWGSCIAYLVIIGDSFSPLLALATGTCNLQMLKQRILRTRLSDALHHGVTEWQSLQFCQAACVAEIHHSQIPHAQAYLRPQHQLQGIDVVMHAGADSIFADRRLVITVVTFVVILPLCFPRELGALAWVSMAAVRLALLQPFPALADLSLGQCSIVCGSARPRCASPSCGPALPLLKACW